MGDSTKLALLVNCIALAIERTRSPHIRTPVNGEGASAKVRRYAAFSERCGMSLPTLTLKSIHARPILLKLKRPVVARIATLTAWPLRLIDLYTEEGVIGHSYLEPYRPLRCSRAVVPPAREVGRAVHNRQFDGGAQCDGSAPAGFAGSAVPAISC
jgi:hypothetical protein